MNSWTFLALFSLAMVILQCLLGQGVLSSPLGGIGPEEDLGHTGPNLPPFNPNVNFGFDFHGIYNDSTTYGRIYNPHRRNQQRGTSQQLPVPNAALKSGNNRKNVQFEEFLQRF